MDLPNTTCNPWSWMIVSLRDQWITSFPPPGLRPPGFSLPSLSSLSRHGLHWELDLSTYSYEFYYICRQKVTPFTSNIGAASPHFILNIPGRLAGASGWASLEKWRGAPCDFHHVGILCTFSNRQAAAAAAWIARRLQLSSSRPGQMVWSVRAGDMDYPARTKPQPAGSLSCSQPGGPSCWASPLAFGLIGPACATFYTYLRQCSNQNN